MGQLIFRYGSMSSGKTMQLLSLVTQHFLQSKKVLLVKPAIDTRFDPGYIVSRTGMKHRFDYSVDFDFDFTKLSGLNMVDCLFVDEAQFLSSKHIEQLKEITVENENLKVICYGLLTDFKSNLFEGSKRLVELSDRLEEILSTCYYCNNFARYNMRHIGNRPVFDGEVIELGCEESYFPVCWTCYSKQKKETKKLKLVKTDM